jgi:hypothetical protein
MWPPRSVETPLTELYHEKLQNLSDTEGVRGATSTWVGRVPRRKLGDVTENATVFGGLLQEMFEVHRQLEVRRG